MTTDTSLIQSLRDAYKTIAAAAKSPSLDRSQRTMLNIALGRLATVGGQLAKGQPKPKSNEVK